MKIIFFSSIYSLLARRHCHFDEAMKPGEGDKERERETKSGQTYARSRWTLDRIGSSFYYRLLLSPRRQYTRFLTRLLPSFGMAAALSSCMYCVSCNFFTNKYRVVDFYYIRSRRHNLYTQTCTHTYTRRVDTAPGRSRAKENRNMGKGAYQVEQTMPTNAWMLSSVWFFRLHEMPKNECAASSMRTNGPRALFGNDQNRNRFSFICCCFPHSTLRAAHKSKHDITSNQQSCAFMNSLR